MERVEGVRVYDYVAVQLSSSTSLHLARISLTLTPHHPHHLQPHIPPYPPHMLHYLNNRI